MVWFKADLDIFRSLEETSSESEKRAEAHAAEWGARLAAPGDVRRPKPARAPPRAASGSGGGLLCLPGEPSERSTLSLSPGWLYPRRRPNPEILSRFRCKRAKGPNALGAGTAVERGSLRGSQGRQAGIPALRPAPRLQPRRPGPESWPRGAEPGRREPGAGKRWGLPGHSPLFSACRMRPRSRLERLRRATFRCPSK